MILHRSLWADLEVRVKSSRCACMISYRPLGEDLVEILVQCCQRPLHDLVQVLVGGDVEYSQQLTNSVVTDKIAQF